MGSLRYKHKLLFFLIPPLAFYFVFFGIPFLRTAYISLFNWNGLSAPEFLGLKNYLDLFKDHLFSVGFGRITIWAILSVLIKVGLALILANLLRTKIRGSGFFTSVFFIPVVISASAISLMFILIYDLDIGALNVFLRMIGLESLTHSWLGDSTTAFYAVIAVPLFHGIGYFFVILLAGIQGVPESLYEAAKVDGANALQLFFRVTIPSIWPVIQICVILAITGALKSFDYIYVMTKGGPGNATQVPATYLYEVTFVGGKFGYGSALAIMIFLFGVVATILFKKFSSVISE